MRNVVALEGLSREDWLAARRQGIGSSDVGPILGLDHWRGPFDVYVDKIDVEEQPSTPVMRLGQHMEDGIARAYAEETGSTIEKPTHLYGHDRHEWMLASPDRFTDNEGLGVLEVKMTSRADDLDDGIPDAWQLQCLWQLAVTGLPYADLAALVGGREIRYYRVERDDPTITNLIQIGAAFWQRVLDRDPPPVDAMSTESLKRLYKGGADAIELPPDFAVKINELRVLKALHKDNETDIEARANEIRAALGDYEIGTLGGVPVVTWGRSLRTGLKLEELRAEYPDLIAAFTKTTPIRTLRIKKPRKT